MLTKMKKSDLVAWTTALRSGKFKQGRGTLCKEMNGKKSYCCEGVWCEVKGMPSSTREQGTHFMFDTGDGNFVVASLEDVRGLETYDKLNPHRQSYLDAIGLPFDVHSKIVEMNDSGTSFEEIAAYLEANVPVEEGL